MVWKRARDGGIISKYSQNFGVCVVWASEAPAELIGGGGGGRGRMCPPGLMCCMGIFLLLTQINGKKPLAQWKFCFLQLLLCKFSPIKAELTVQRLNIFFIFIFIVSFLSNLLGHATEIPVLAFLLPKGDPGLFLWLCHLDPVVKLGLKIDVTDFQGVPSNFLHQQNVLRELFHPN